MADTGRKRVMNYYEMMEKVQQLETTVAELKKWRDEFVEHQRSAFPPENIVKADGD